MTPASQAHDPPGASLADLRFSLAGPGRVGESLAGWLVSRGARLAAVAGRQLPGRADEVARRLGGRAVSLAALGASGEDLLLLAVPDPALPAVAAALSGRRRAAVALHTAGSRSAEVLAPLAADGTAIGSLHPLKAFARVFADPAEARGMVFGIDGDPEALLLAARLAAALGAEVAPVPAPARRLYHFAASLAAGGVVTVLAAADGIARELGLPAAVGRGYLELARGALAEAAQAPVPAAALTGPVARGDGETVLAALAELARLDPGAHPAALAVCRETLRQLARRAAPGPAQAALARSLTGLCARSVP